MHTKVTNTKYPLIDQDPHFTRVVRYFRQSDYAYAAAGTAAFPGALYFLEYADRSRPMGPLRVPKGPMLYGTILGFVGGFLFAYQRSSFRFWGWTENQREQEMDKAEMTERIRKGEPLYGTSPQPEWVQMAAAGNSTYSALKFSIFPMFNFVNHQHHGVDQEKYGTDTTKASSQEEKKT